MKSDVHKFIRDITPANLENIDIYEPIRLINKSKDNNDTIKTLEINNETQQQTIMKLPLGIIFQNTLNFFSNSVDQYSDMILKAEVTLDRYEHKSPMDHLTLHTTAIILFIKEDQNCIYLGIICMFLAVIMYLCSIIIND